MMVAIKFSTEEVDALLAQLKDLGAKLSDVYEAIAEKVELIKEDLGAEGGGSTSAEIEKLRSDVPGAVRREPDDSR